MNKQHSHALSFALNGLSRCGADTPALVKKFGLDAPSMRDRATPVSTKLWCAILDEAVRQTQDPNLGLKANQGADLADYGPLGFAILNANDLGEALTTMTSYVGLSQAGLKTSYRVARGVCTLEIHNTDWRVPVHRTNIDWAISCSLAFIRTWCGQGWCPEKIHVTYSEPDDTSIYGQIIGCPVSFSSASNCVVFKADILERTSVDADPRLFQILQNDLNRLLGQVIAAAEEQNELITQTQTEVARLLCNGAPNIEKVAAHLNMSTRTLQRRLTDKGCTFKALVDDTRFLMAENYMRSSHHSLIDVAFLLGYSEVSAFNRAFRRWTGQTPVQYRNGI